MGTQIKAINFDLDTNALKEHYPGKGSLNRLFCRATK